MCLDIAPLPVKKKGKIGKGERKEKMMTVKKEDWSFDKKMIYQNKQGVNKEPRSSEDLSGLFGVVGKRGFDGIHLRGYCGAGSLFDSLVKIISNM